jgi:hypothetical protein
MSNITLNPATGGPTVATDVHGGDHYQRIKVAGNRQAFWPGYGPPDSTDPVAASVDDGGALITRGAVLTDEGTFRCNFANTSVAVGIGSVTVSGTTVTGTGFLNADVHYKDYFKLSADGESAWRQIESIDSDAQMTLVSAYTGGTSGTGERALMQPFTGAGGSLAVASGALTIGGGTTATSITGIKRLTDYAPLIFRARLSISQRIANQEIHIGLEEDAATTRWFARFLADGTTATTIKCETGRNPTGAPSAAETETVTVTLPNGRNTSQSLEYRVEMLAESVRFYVEGVLVAENARSMPHQHDEMTSHVEIRNGTTPASNTNVVVDYITSKNHNKVEVGVMSEREQIVAKAAPLVSFTFNQSGVIAINTDLLVLDCRQIRALMIGCRAMGTSGVVTVQWAHEPTFANPFTVTLLSEAGAVGTTFNAAGLRYANVLAPYCRLRLTTATTAGTTTLDVWGSESPIPYFVGTQPVSGTLTANIGTGSIAAGTNLIGDFGMQVRANATGAMSGHHIVSAATTNVAQIKATAGRVFGWSLSNTTASWRYVKLHNVASATAGSGVTQTIGIPPNATVEATFPFGIAFATAISRSVVTGAADADATATGVADVVGDIFFA